MKIHLLIALVGLAISFALPTFAQEQSAVDPETRQEIEAVAMQSVEAYNKHDAAAIAALYTLDAVRVLDRGGSTNFVGRDGIEKYYEDRLQKLHFSNHIIEFDPDSPHVIGTAGNEMWATGEWSVTLQGQNGPAAQLQGYWGATKAREGDTWKTRMDVYNITPRPAATGTATPSPTTTRAINSIPIPAVTD